MVPSGENASESSLSEFCPNCSSSSYPAVDVTKAVTLGLVLGVFVIFGVLGNILVILSVACHRHLRSVTHYFVANLAAADLLLSSAVLPFSATSEALGRWVFGRTFCNAWAALDVLCCTASILSLCVISIDRYLAVSYPLRYPAFATERRGLAAVVALWGLSAAISVGPLFGWKEADPEDETECRITEEPGYALFSALGSFYVPLAIILAMYCRVYVVARRRTRGLRGAGRKKESVEMEGVMLRIHRGNTPATDRLEEEEEGGEGVAKKQRKRKCTTFGLMRLLKFSREKKAAKTLGIVVGCFVLCWLPFFLVLPIGSIFPSYRPSDTIFKITFWLGYFNSCINPIIYPCFSQEFKKAFLNVLRGRCLRRSRPRQSLQQPAVCSYSSSGGGSMPTLRVTPPPSNGQDDPPSTWSCCRALSGSSASVNGLQDPAGQQSARVQSKTLLKAWCFAGREASPPRQDHSSSNGPRKILRLSLGAPGDAV